MDLPALDLEVDAVDDRDPGGTGVQILDVEEGFTHRRKDIPDPVYRIHPSADADTT
jgi:hypothetical protein